MNKKILMALMVLTSTVWASSKKSSQTTSFSTRSSKIPPKYQTNLMKKKVQSVSKKAPSLKRLSPATQRKMEFLQGVLISSKRELKEWNEQAELINLIFSALPSGSIPTGSTISTLLAKL